MQRILHTLCAITATLAVVVGTDAKTPAKQAADGITISGTVCCEGKPLAGVTVSDGVLFATTDAEGRYALASKKYQGVVFVITPSGYEPVCKKGVLPQFWAHVKSQKPDKAEQHDFELRRVDNVRHRMIVSADMHLANRCDDLRQLKSTYIPAIRTVADEAARDSVPVYSIILGDLSSSAHWYSNEFDIDDALHSIVASGYPTMLYTVMGEQDYDGSVPSGALTDHKAERLYVYSCGPKYYAMNIGDIHYVVLDNTLFRNEAGDGKYPAEIVGKRNFDRFVSSDQLSWLRHDLSLIEDKTTPIVVCMHHNAFRTATKGAVSSAFSEQKWLDSLVGCFRQFDNVHFFTGHSHRKRLSVSAQLPNIVEHDLPSASGNAWATVFDGYAHVCPDGTSPGFEVCDIVGRDIAWRYCTEEYGYRTFRAYDMRSVGKYYRENNDVRNFIKEYPERLDYGMETFGSYVYINWWCYEPEAKLEVWEGDKQLKARQVYQEDPLYTVAADVFRLKNSRGRKPTIRKNSCQHLFRVKPLGDSTALRIRTTDRFGNVFEEEFRRPSDFKVTGD
ncbi:MAG: calcineurin-like phosphoesterase C-terminal domain-containing protein [Alistipes sp.]